MTETVSGPAKGKLQAWAAPGADDELWYPIAAMRWPHEPVFVSLAAGGFHGIAEIRKHPRRKIWWWYQVGRVLDDGWTRVSEMPLEMYGREPETDWSPVAFRPLDLSAWRHPLPEPLTPALGPKRPPARTPEPPEGIDPHQGSDDWPYPGLRLGMCTAPSTREECEARILRAFRTSASRAGGRVGLGPSGFCADIPSDFIRIALKNGEAERLREERRLGISQSAEALRSGWTPSKRDIDDWDYALGWLNSVDRASVDVVELRAADPPYSFRQIAGRLRVPRPTIQNWYARAIDVAFASARCNGG